MNNQYKFYRDENGNEEFELSKFQKYVLSVIIGTQGEYRNISCGTSMRLNNGFVFDEERMQNAIQKLFDDNDALRTILVKRGDDYRQKIVTNYKYKLNVHEVEGETIEERFENAIEAASAIANSNIFAFDKITMHFDVFKIDEDDYLVSTVQNHLFSDGISVSIALKQLIRNYNDLDCESNSSSYHKFCVEEQKLFDSEDGVKQFEYWNKEIEGYIPIDIQPKNKNSVNSMQLSQIKFESDKLRALSRNIKTSYFNIFIAAYHIALSKYFNRNDTLISFAVANRRNMEFYQTIGLLTRTIQHRLIIEENDAITDVIQKCMKTVDENTSNQECGGYNILTPFLFSVQADADITRNINLNSGTIEFVPLRFRRQIELFCMITNEFNNELNVVVACETSIFGVELVEYFKKAVSVIISEIEKNSNTLIKDININ